MKVFASPSRYIQGKNALFTNAETLKQLGDNPFYCVMMWFMVLSEKHLKFIWQITA